MDFVVALADLLPLALGLASVVVPVVWLPTCLVLVVLSFFPRTEQDALKTLKIVCLPSGLRPIRWLVDLCRTVAWLAFLPVVPFCVLRKSTSRRARRVMVVLSGRATGKRRS